MPTVQAATDDIALTPKGEAYCLHHRRLALRRRAQECIDLLIFLMDQLDDDPDLEDGHDREAENDDREGGDILDEPHDGEGDDMEPELGATEAVDQGQAWKGYTGDRWIVEAGEQLLASTPQEEKFPPLQQPSDPALEPPPGRRRKAVRKGYTGEITIIGPDLTPYRLHQRR